MSNILFSDCKSGDWAVVPNVELAERIACGLGVTDYVVEPEPQPKDALEPFTYKPPFLPQVKVSDTVLNIALGLGFVLSFLSGAVFAAGYLVGRIYG